MSFETLSEAVLQYLPQIVGALLTLLLGYLLAKLVTSALQGGMQRAKVDATLTRFATNLAYMAAMTLVVVSALGQLGINTTSFAAVLAAAGVAIGFALQGSLSNFAAGVMLILFRPFSVGDFVEAGGVAGTVEEVQVFATRFNTPDNKRIIVPNAAITGGSITNYSANPTRRIDLVFGIGYGDDAEKAKQLIARILEQEPRVLAEPAPFIGVCELAASSVNIAVRPWVNGADFWGTRCDLLDRVKREFDAQGISIPFPQQEVHLHQVA